MCRRSTDSAEVKQIANKLAPGEITIQNAVCCDFWEVSPPNACVCDGLETLPAAAEVTETTPA